MNEIMFFKIELNSKGLNDASEIKMKKSFLPFSIEYGEYKKYFSSDINDVMCSSPSERLCR